MDRVCYINRRDLLIKKKARIYYEYHNKRNNDPNRFETEYIIDGNNLPDYDRMAGLLRELVNKELCPVRIDYEYEVCNNSTHMIRLIRYFLVSD